MSFFSPHKRHANEFKYTPRYYDPVKEAREQRRQEMTGRRLDDNERERKPGDLIRAKREAREAAKSKRIRSNRAARYIKMLGLVALILALMWLGNSLLEVFSLAGKQHGTVPTQAEREVEAFNPEAPLIIVPNDYQEGDELIIEDIELE